MIPLSKIEIHAADHCVQKCAHCSHAADIAAKRFYGPEDYLPHLQAMHEKGIRWGSIEILGGEPFINPKLESMLDMLYEFGGHRVVMSNMFWLKSEDDIEKHASVLNKIQTLVITLYKPLVEKSGGLSHVGIMLNIIRSRFPDLEINSFGHEKKAVDIFAKVEFHKQRLPVINDVCGFRGCKQLLHDGRLLGCCAARRVLSWSEIDVFDLNRDWTAAELAEWYGEPMLNLCSHCSIATKGIEYVPWSLVD